MIIRIDIGIVWIECSYNFLYIKIWYIGVVVISVCCQQTEHRFESDIYRIKYGELDIIGIEAVLKTVAGKTVVGSSPMISLKIK